MNTSRSSRKKSAPALLAFGAASAIGILAAVLWAPSAGQQTRSKLAARLRTLAQPLMGRGRPRPGGQPAAVSGGANLAMQPDHLLDKP